MIASTAARSIQKIPIRLPINPGVSFVSIICESTYNYSIYYKKNLEKIIKDINTISKRERNKYIKNNERLVTNYFIKVIKKFNLVKS